MERDKKILPSEEILQWQSRVEKIKQYVSVNLASDLRVTTVCQKLSINKFTLQHIFTQQEKETFHQYVQRMRMDKAFNLLKEGKWVKEVIVATGYKNRVAFNKAFKRRFKHSASYFRK